MCRALSNLSLPQVVRIIWVLRGCRGLQDQQVRVEEAAVDRQDQQEIRDRQVRAALQVLVALQGLQALLAQEGARAQLAPLVGPARKVQLQPSPVPLGPPAIPALQGRRPQ